MANSQNGVVMTLKALSMPIAASLALILMATGCGQAANTMVAGAGEDRLAAQDEIRGWLSWRGPEQNGVSRETDLPDQIDLDSPDQTWTYQLRGRGTPVIGNGRVYAMGYEGNGAELQEVLVCLDAGTGQVIWEHRFTEFLSDSIYHRFAISSPTIDPETGNVLCLTTAGLFSCFTADGELEWQHSMMSEYGRLTFPNGRTGSPLVDGELTIVHIIGSSWGPYGPARDRFYAFDKLTGEAVWSSAPGIGPRDSSFSYPVVTAEGDKRVLYAGLGGGSMVAVDVRTGDPLWRFAMAIGGINSSAVLYKDSLIAIHGKENVDSSVIGRMIAIKRGVLPESGAGPAELDPKQYELWRNDLVAFTSSPVLVGNRVYATGHTGELACVDADSGEVLWHEKLAPDQIHASPAWGDGKLYVPMNNGTFHIVRPSDQGAEVVQTVQLEGNCLGAPAIAGGRIYVHTTERLYGFGTGSGAALPGRAVPDAPPAGAPVRLQVIPADLVMQQGGTVPFRVRSVDANGIVASDNVASADWTGTPDGISMAGSEMRVGPNAEPTAFVLNASADGLAGTSRVRIVPRLPFSFDFENTTLAPHASEPGVFFARPPPYWLGATLKWEVREREGDNVLARTLDNPLFQRTISLIGHPDMSNYTVQTDILSDGNRRSMSSAGVLNQRYLIQLKGNYQQIEVSSNVDLLKETADFTITPNIWYTLKTRVDLEADGSGWIRAKAWPREEPEPDSWTIEVHHFNAHTHGSPGLFGFTPQSRFRVYIDNLSVTSNG